MAQVRVTFLAGLAVAGAALFFSGCQSKTTAKPEQLMKALNAKLVDQPQCLMPDAPHFPYETTDPEKTKQMDALVNAQLLEVKRAPAIHESRYTTTPLGGIAAPRFCYGHRYVTAIISSTPPALANGFPETNVVYQYEIRDVPVWAKTPQMETTFPEMAKAIASSATGTAVLAKTMAGWTVPN